MRRFGRTGRGFTLIELMIVVAVIAVLMLIALPSYTRYTFRARRGEGQELLLRLANAQERYYATYNKYAQDPVDDLKFATDLSAGGYYKITIDQLTGTTFDTGYVAKAAPQQSQAGDSCGTLSIDSRGTKSQTGSTTANGRCW
ncbi:type IV pilin protein [Luteibacter yeojuensis]